MRFPFLHRPTLLGLDIQPDGIRLLQLKKIKQSFLLEKLTAFATPPGIFEDGKIKLWEVFCPFLSEIVLGLNIKGLGVVVNVPMDQVRLQKIKLSSDLQEINVHQEIFNHIETDLPGMKATLCMDFYTLEQTTTHVDHVYMIAKKEYLQQLTQCIKSCGLKLQIVDVDVFALKRMLDFLSPIQNNALNACVHASENAILFFVHTHNEIIFHARWHKQNSSLIASYIVNQLQVNQLEGHINKIVICATKYICQTLKHALMPSINVETIHDLPFESIKLGHFVDQQQFKENIVEYMLAFGSALQVKIL